MCELRVIPWKLACTACCTAQLYNLVWTVSLQGLWPKLNWEAPWDPGLGVFYSVSNGTLIRPASTRFVIGLSHACSAESLCRSGVYGGGVYGGGWIWS
jgi:hypothetical protein